MHCQCEFKYVFSVYVFDRTKSNRIAERESIIGLPVGLF